MEFVLCRHVHLSLSLCACVSVCVCVCEQEFGGGVGLLGDRNPVLHPQRCDRCKSWLILSLTVRLLYCHCVLEHCIRRGSATVLSTLSYWPAFHDFPDFILYASVATSPVVMQLHRGSSFRRCWRKKNKQQKPQFPSQKPKHLLQIHWKMQLKWQRTEGIIPFTVCPTSH